MQVWFGLSLKRPAQICRDPGDLHNEKRVLSTESARVVQRKQATGHRCKTAQHLPARSDSQCDTTGDKEALFY